MINGTTPPNQKCREKRTLSLLIVEDNHFLREVLRMLFDSAGIEHIVEAATLREAIGILDSQTVDVVLLDLRLPDGNGLDLLAKIREFDNSPSVVINSFQHSAPLLVRCFRQGANGYFTKGENKNALVAGVLRAADGEWVWDPEQLTQIAELESICQNPMRHSQPLAEQL